MQNPAPEPVRPLPVLVTCNRALRLLGRNAPTLARLAVVPMLGSLLATGATFFLLYQKWIGDLGITILLTIAITVLLVPFAVAIHRMILIGAQAVPRFGFRFSVRELKFLGWCMAFGAAYGATLVFVGSPFEQPNLAQSLIPALLHLGVTALMLRFALLLPAVTVDATFGLMDSWRLTRGQTVRLIAIFLILNAPLLGLDQAVGWLSPVIVNWGSDAGIPGAILGGTGVAGLAMLNGMIKFAVFAAALSVWYQSLTEKRDL